MDGNAYSWEQFLEHYTGNAPGAWHAAPEVRWARDGMTYTMQEFINEYGPHDGIALFNEARPRAATEHSRAWANSGFALHFLPEREQRLIAAPPQSRSLRGALQSAYAAAADLPLRADVFYNGDIRAALGRPGAVLVTAETINHVRDPNRDGELRVDFIAYDITGAFTRYRPGATGSQDATPHAMQQSSRAFSLDIALQLGAGAALHAQVPAVACGAAAATEHGDLTHLCTAMDLLEIHPLDAKLISPRVLQRAMEAALLQAGADAVDWSHGGFRQGYPWWVFMAGRMQRFAAMLNEGTVLVTVERGADRRPFLAVTTAAGQYAERMSGSRVSIK